MVDWEALPVVEERDGHGSCEHKEQPREGAKCGAGLDCAARTTSFRTSNGVNVGRCGNPASEPRKDSHHLDADANVADQRAFANDASGNELEYDDQDSPRCAEEHEAPGVGCADGDGEVAGGGMGDGAVHVICVDGYMRTRRSQN